MGETEALVRTRSEAYNCDLYIHITYDRFKQIIRIPILTTNRSEHAYKTGINHYNRKMGEREKYCK